MNFEKQKGKKESTKNEKSVTSSRGQIRISEKKIDFLLLLKKMLQK
jgi:hypothetical protein